MKKALLLALAALFSVAAPALAYPPAAANVNFSSEQGVPFGLVLDGRPLTRGLARQVHVDQLVPGLHWADFSVPTGYGGAVRLRSRVWLAPGLETTFVLIARPGRPLGLQQVNAVALYGPNGNYGPGGYGGGPGRYNSPTPYGQGGYGSNAPYNGGNPNSGYGNNPNGPNGGYNTNPTGPNGGYNSPNGSNGGYNNGGGYNNNPNDPNGGYNNAPGNGGGYYPGSSTSSYRTLAPQDVDALVQTVKQQRFEADKLTAAKDALSQSAIQTDDLKRLLLTLDYEGSRVDLAKFGYSHVVDPQNFSRVYQALNSEASKRDVEQAVSAEPQH